MKVNVSILVDSYLVILRVKLNVFVDSCLILNIKYVSVDSLAYRLESEKDGELSLYASLCYICSGNVEKLVENWVRNTENNNAPLALQVKETILLQFQFYLE